MVQFLNERSNSGDRVRRRAENRRQEILHSAARVFRKRGFEAAGMREIAEEADLSPGNLYHYFSGKHEILYFCQDRALDSMLEALQRAESAAGPLARRLEILFSEHIRCILGEMAGSAAHLAVDSLPPELRQAIVEKRDRYETGVRKLVEEGQQSGEFIALEPGIITRAIFGSMNWTAQWFDPAGRQSPGEVAETIARYLVQGLTGNTTS